MDNRESLERELNRLLHEREALDRTIERLKKKLNSMAGNSLSKNEKIALFRSLLVGREDVYAQYWVSKDGNKSGYSPQAYTFRGRDWKPLTDEVIRRHLEGKIRIGTYVVFDGNKTRFLAIDLDKKTFMDDARVLVTVCRELSLEPLIEISKSGAGVHLWLFFDEPVLAAEARQLGDLCISRAMDRSDGISMGSFDRIFPHQDFVDEEGLGNLIALPLHYGSRQENKTVFVDPNSWKPYEDQWSVLRNADRISRHRLMKILQENSVKESEENFTPWLVDKRVPIRLPKSVRGVLYDAIHIEAEGFERAAVNRLMRMASFSNPEFFLRQRLRKSTYNVPRLVTLFDRNQRFLILPRGLKEELEKWFADQGSRIVWEDRRLHEKVEFPRLKLEPREEQAESIEALLPHEYGILLAPPGFGKTFVAAAVMARRSVSTLVLVHKTTLLEQWRDRLSEYLDCSEDEIGMLGKGKKRLNGRMDIATLQSLRRRPELIAEYSQVIVDEAHHIPAASYDIPLRRFRGHYLLGLSATPYRKDGMHPIMFLQCGPLIHRIEPSVRKRHRVKVHFTGFETMQEDFPSILNEMVECEARNALIVESLMQHRGRKFLLLSERIEHLNLLYHLFDNRGLNAVLLHGSLGTRLEKEMKKRVKEAEVILSTSGYIGEGVDIGHLDGIVLTMPISYRGRMVQYLGRIGRQGQSCLALDFVDEKVPVLKASFRKRKGAYREMGYVVSKESESSTNGLFV